MPKKFTRPQLQKALQHGIGDPSFAASLKNHLEGCVIEHLTLGRRVTTKQFVSAINAVTKTLQHLAGDHFEVVVDYQIASKVVLSAIAIGVQEDSIPCMVESATDAFKKMEQRVTNAADELLKLNKKMQGKDTTIEDWIDGQMALKYPQECALILKAVSAHVVPEVTAGSVQLLLKEIRSELTTLPSRLEHELICHIQMCREVSAFVCEFEFELRKIVAPEESPAKAYQKIAAVVVDDGLRGILVDAFKLKSDLRLTATLLDVPLVEDPRLTIHVDVLSAALF
jgi:hypothetical protein